MKRRARDSVAVWLLVVAALAVAVWILAAPDAVAPEPPGPGLTHVASITEGQPDNHLHGIGFDPLRERLYLATHFGLYLHQGGHLWRVGEVRDDLMAFTLDPSDGDRMHASGHPATGGNLGVIRSTDGGHTWQPIFTGVADERVDFHAMATGRADPDTLVGWFGGLLYVSGDGGESWRADHEAPMGPCWAAPCLALHSEDPETVYAGSHDGLLVSHDLGANWAGLREGPHAAVTMHPVDGALYAFGQDGVVRSTDAGATWQAVGAPHPAGDVALFQLEPDPRQAGALFAAAFDGSVHRTVDGGASWQRVL